MVAASASLTLVLLAGALLFPTTPDSAHAEETGTQATLTINPVLSLGLDSAVTMSVQPTSTGEFTSGSAELTVSTNNETGYSLYLSTANGKATLDSINPATTTAVQPVSGTVAAENFGANTWGYNLGKDAATNSTTYQAVPTTATAPQATTTGPTLGDGTLAADTYSLNFGALINSDLPSGTYTNTVTVSVVTNPAYLPSFEGIETMQEMTPTICSNADEGETARLKDARDDKLYWVTKLKDGNCWMTQNLDYDISADGITGEEAEQTDLQVGTVWDSSSSYPPRATTNSVPFGEESSNTSTFSFDPGMYVNDPSKGWTNCNTYYVDISTCTAGNWTDVSSMSPMATERTDGTVVDGNTYDAHYLVGNYYQWNTATAGTGANVATAGDSAPSSICPNGWKLPTSGDSNTSLGSFAYLTNGIDIRDILAQAPYYFIPTGFVSGGPLGSAGTMGYYWSSTLESNDYGDAYGFFLSFNKNGGNVSASTGSVAGMPVRCLAR